MFQKSNFESNRSHINAPSFSYQIARRGQSKHIYRLNLHVDSCLSSNSVKHIYIIEGRLINWPVSNKNENDDSINELHDYICEHICCVKI